MLPLQYRKPSEHWLSRRLDRRPPQKDDKGVVTKRPTGIFSCHPENLSGWPRYVSSQSLLEKLISGNTEAGVERPRIWCDAIPKRRPSLQTGAGLGTDSAFSPSPRLQCFKILRRWESRPHGRAAS